MARESYDQFVYEINSLLKNSELYPLYRKSIEDGKNDFKLSQVFTKKNYSTDWIEMLEECVNSLDTIVRNPRKFIVIEEDIVDISLARSISVESVKHLAQHTNLISSVNKQGMVIPSKILNTSKEESFEIYENRFIYTLLLKARDFLNIRMDAIQGALMESGELGVNVKSEYLLDGQKVEYELSSRANFPFDTVVKGKASGGLSDLERLQRIKSIFGDFLASAFAKEMSSCALVRPPIQRTNVILKDPNFKKALVLWEYIESSEKMEFKIETETETMDQPPALQDRYRSLIFFNTVLMQSIAASREGANTYEEEKERKKTIADEYVSKNIDDFVPDDFPFLKMELSEIRRIYYKIPGQKSLKLTEIAKMNAALDRVYRQYRINKASEESALRKRLIAEQKKEEEQAKKLALREAKEEERRKKQQEIFEKREKARLEKERIAAEKAAEAERIAREKEAEAERIRLEEAERKAREERERLEKEEEELRIKLEREEKAERLRIEAEAAEKVRAEEEANKEREQRRIREEAVRLAEEENAKRKDALEREQTAYRERLAAYAENVLSNLRLEAEKTRLRERELAIRLLTEEMTEPLDVIQQETLRKLIEEEAVGAARIEQFERETKQRLNESLEERVKRLEMEARTFRSLSEVVDISRRWKEGMPSKRKYTRHAKLLRTNAVKKALKQVGKKRKKEKGGEET